jgi:hypothetical protein
VFFAFEVVQKMRWQLVLLVSAPLAISGVVAQNTDRQPVRFGKTAAQKDKPAVIQDLNVFLPPYSSSMHPSTCTDKLKQAVCQARIQQLSLWQQGRGELDTGLTLLKVDDYSAAKQHCLLALDASSKAPKETMLVTLPGYPMLPDYSAQAERCISRAESEQDVIDKAGIQALASLTDQYLATGDIEKAKILRDQLQKRYSELPASSSEARKYAEQQLNETDSWSWNTALAWFRSRLLPLLAQIAVGLGGILWVFILLKAYRWIRNVFRRFSPRRKTKWFVQHIKDKEGQAGGGAVMDALSISGNALLREPFRPSSLLLVPPGFSGPQGGGVWWNFFGAVRPTFEVEWVPRENIERHEFVLEEALEEINLKIAGQEVGGMVSLARNVSRWFNRGTPTVQGAILKVLPMGGNPSWAVRLTATSAYRWANWLRTFNTDKHLYKNLTVSVYSSTEEQEFVDAIGLAAQRAAFKLFYRLADPDKDPDEITAVAAFHQGVVLLRRYL